MGVSITRVVSGGPPRFDAAFGEEVTGDAGASSGVFDLQQVASVGHHLVAATEPGVHLANDLAERLGIVCQDPGRRT